jgi:hypothetical protein
MAAQPATPTTPESPPPTAAAPATQDPAVTTDPAATAPVEDVIAGGVAYGADSGYVAFRAAQGTNLQVRLAGAEPQNILLDLADADFEPGYVYTVFITGTTFEDYAIGYVKVVDSRLGGGTEEDAMTAQREQEQDATQEADEGEELEPEEEEEGESTN